jgi:hypothetical protein
MKNKEELKKKSHDRSRKNDMSPEGEKYPFQKGGGIKIVFGPNIFPCSYICRVHVISRRFYCPGEQ